MAHAYIGISLDGVSNVSASADNWRRVLNSLPLSNRPPGQVVPNSHELLLRLHWVAVICGSVKADMALTGGVHSATDVVKTM